MRKWVKESELTGLFIDYINSGEALTEIYGGLYYPADILMKLDPKRFDRELIKYVESQYVKRWDNGKFMYYLNSEVV